MTEVASLGGKLSGWLKFPVMLLLAAGIGQSLAQLTWAVLEDHQVVVRAMPQATSAGAEPQGADYARLPELDLLGRPMPVARQPELAEIEAPDTALKLELEGVLVAARKEDSSAIIAERGKPGKFFKVGDKVQSNAELAAVYTDKVILARGGKYETLRFSDKRKGERQLLERTPRASAQPRTSARDPLVGLNLPSNELTQDIQQLTPKQFLTTYGQKLEADPQQVLNQAGLEPVRGADGKPGGYRIGNSQYSRLLSNVGLRQGDIIRSVNGHPIGDVQRDRQLMQELARQSEVQVEIQRGSRRFIVSYPLR